MNHSQTAQTQVARIRLAPFILLQVASLFSLAAGSMVFLLYPWMAIDLTNSATSAGLLVTLTSIPGLLMSPVIGSIIDKLGRRNSAIFSELAAAATAVAIPLVAAFGGLNLTALAIIGVVRAIVGSGGGIARKALIPDVATAGKLTLERANSIHESVFAAGFAIGPAVAAICIDAIGASNAFWVVAVLGALAGVITLLIRVHEHYEEHHEESGNLAVYAVQGFKALFSTPSVLIVMSAIMTLAVIYMPTEMVVLPTYYRSIGNPQGLGFLITTMATFTTIGSLLFEWATKRFSFRNLLRIAILGVGIGMTPMAFLPPQWAMVVCGALLGLAWGPLPPLLNTVIQRKVPANVRGRVFSLEMTIWTAGPLITMTLAGWAVDTLGVHIVYPIIAIGVLLAGIVVSTRKALADLDSAALID